MHICTRIYFYSFWIMTIKRYRSALLNNAMFVHVSMFTKGGVYQIWLCLFVRVGCLNNRPHEYSKLLRIQSRGNNTCELVYFWQDLATFSSRFKYICYNLPPLVYHKTQPHTRSSTTVVLTETPQHLSEFVLWIKF